MRTLAAIVAALAVVPAASAAKSPPPIRPDSVHALRIAAAPKPQHASCSVRSRSKTRLGKASRKILPVACEQPPRVQVNGVGSVTALLAP